MCITNEYLWRDYILAVAPGMRFSGQQLLNEKNGRHYDVLKFTDSSQGKEFSFYFDVSSFYGKPGIILSEGDAPMPNKAFTLPEIFGEAGESMINAAKSMGIDLLALTVTFKQYSSEMVSQYVAI
jgi:hypothetical protein